MSHIQNQTIKTKNIDNSVFLHLDQASKEAGLFLNYIRNSYEYTEPSQPPLITGINEFYEFARYFLMLGGRTKHIFFKTVQRYYNKVRRAETSYLELRQFMSDKGYDPDTFTMEDAERYLEETDVANLYIENVLTIHKDFKWMASRAYLYSLYGFFKKFDGDMEDKGFTTSEQIIKFYESYKSFHKHKVYLDPIKEHKRDFFIPMKEAIGAQIQKDLVDMLNQYTGLHRICYVDGSVANFYNSRTRTHNIEGEVIQENQGSTRERTLVIKTKKIEKLYEAIVNAYMALVFHYCHKDIDFGEVIDIYSSELLASKFSNSKMAYFVHPTENEAQRVDILKLLVDIGVISGYSDLPYAAKEAKQLILNTNFEWFPYLKEKTKEFIREYDLRTAKENMNGLVELDEFINAEYISDNSLYMEYEVEPYVNIHRKAKHNTYLYKGVAGYMEKEDAVEILRSEEDVEGKELVRTANSFLTHFKAKGGLDYYVNIYGRDSTHFGFVGFKKAQKQAVFNYLKAQEQQELSYVNYDITKCHPNIVFALAHMLLDSQGSVKLRRGVMTNKANMIEKIEDCRLLLTPEGIEEMALALNVTKSDVKALITPLFYKANYKKVFDSETAIYSGSYADIVRTKYPQLKEDSYNEYVEIFADVIDLIYNNIDLLIDIVSGILHSEDTSDVYAYNGVVKVRKEYLRSLRKKQKMSFLITGIERYLIMRSSAKVASHTKFADSYAILSDEHDGMMLQIDKKLEKEFKAFFNTAFEDSFNEIFYMCNDLNPMEIKEKPFFEGTMDSLGRTKNPKMETPKSQILDEEGNLMVDLTLPKVVVVEEEETPAADTLVEVEKEEEVVAVEEVPVLEVEEVQPEEVAEEEVTLVEEAVEEIAQPEEATKKGYTLTVEELAEYIVLLEHCSFEEAIKMIKEDEEKKKKEKEELEASFAAAKKREQEEDEETLREATCIAIVEECSFVEALERVKKEKAQKEKEATETLEPQPEVVEVVEEEEIHEDDQLDENGQPAWVTKYIQGLEEAERASGQPQEQIIIKTREEILNTEVANHQNIIPDEAIERHEKEGFDSGTPVNPDFVYDENAEVDWNFVFNSDLMLRCKDGFDSSVYYIPNRERVMSYTDEHYTEVLEYVRGAVRDYHAVYMDCIDTKAPKEKLDKARWNYQTLTCFWQAYNKLKEEHIRRNYVPEVKEVIKYAPVDRYGEGVVIVTREQVLQRIIDRDGESAKNKMIYRTVKAIGGNRDFLIRQGLLAENEYYDKDADKPQEEDKEFDIYENTWKDIPDHVYANIVRHNEKFFGQSDRLKVAVRSGCELWLQSQKEKKEKEEELKAEREFEAYQDSKFIDDAEEYWQHVEAERKRYGL